MLAAHPDVCLANGKEPDFFDRFWENGVEWYRAQFPDPAARVLLDASVSYSQARLVNGSSLPDGQHVVAERIASVCPAARFIYVVREPVARTYSGYQHSVRHRYEDRPFAAVIRSDNAYENTSYYAAQLRGFMDLFPRERFFIVTYERFKRTPAETIADMIRFLGLDAEALPPTVGDLHANKSYELTPAGRAVRALFPSNESFKATMLFVRRLMPGGLRSHVADILRKDVPPIGVAEARLLRERFREKNAEFAALTGLDLSEWDTEERSDPA